MRYHANPQTGRVDACKAKEGKCPFGEEMHGESLSEVSFKYDAYVRGDTDPETNPFASFSKRPKRNASETVREQRNSKWRDISERAKDLVFDNGIKLSIAAGLLAAVGTGASLAHHHATQDYQPVEGTVASSTVDSYTQWRKVGKVSTPHTVYTTTVDVDLANGDSTSVDYSGKEDFTNGENITIYAVGDDYEAVKPNSGEQYAKDAVVGLVSGTAVSIAGLAAVYVAETRSSNRAYRRRMAGIVGV